MALIKGVNCGFVTTAPTADPTETGVVVDRLAMALKDTSPVGNNRITEIGWYQSNPGNDATGYGCGIYSHDAVNDRPDALIEQAIGQAVMPNLAGWYSYTGLAIDIVGNTPYWIAVIVTDTANPNNTDYVNAVGERCCSKPRPFGSFPNPWGKSEEELARLVAFYAKYEAVGSPPSASADRTITVSSESRISTVKSENRIISI